jgi:Fe-S cluster assembly iron-binding protein IscA
VVNGGPVLTLTDAAAKVLDDLAAASPLDRPGLRVTQREDSRALTMGLAAGPEADDEVIVVQGAPVFLDPLVVGRLDEAVLDVKTEPGAAAFFLRD